MIADTLVGGLFLSVVDMAVVFAVLFGLAFITKGLSTVIRRGEEGGGNPKKVEPPRGRTSDTVADWEEPLRDGEDDRSVAAVIAAAAAACEGRYSFANLKVSGVFNTGVAPSQWALLGRQRQIMAKVGR
ncbi:MAG TPA: OadG family protein [Firmicutes bacterium]|nr:OadG family protein [Bacillota bacterium]